MIILKGEAAATEIVSARAFMLVDSASETRGRASDSKPAAAIDLVSYLEAVVERMTSARSMSAKFLLQTDFSCTIALPLAKAVPVGLIVGELVTNSIKYAHPTGVMGIVRLESSRRDGAIVIEVSDDGIGLPVDFDPFAAKDGGFAMIRRLAAHLRASVSFDNHGLGLSCALRMPYAEAAL